MEPDLDRLLDFESGGALFPQFKHSWLRIFRAAQNCVEGIIEGRSARARVAIRTLDPQSFAALFIAMSRTPVDLFLFNPSWGKKELAEAIEISEPHCIVGEFVDGRFNIDFRTAHLGGWGSSETDKLRVMIATGGTSGKIRFAVHDWSTLAAAVYGFQQHVGCDHMASHCLLPLYHVSGFMQLVRALLTMGTLSFGKLDTFPESHRVLADVRPKDRFLSLVATQLERLLAVESNHPLLREYSAVFIGGGPASVGLLDDCRTLRIPLAPTYGMTETAAQVATLLPQQFLRGEGNQGRSLPHVSISIVSEMSKEEKVPAGSVGLIRIAAKSQFKGYWGDEESRGESHIVTSDLGRIEQNGTLSVLGRADGVIISGGEKVNLREVEICIEESNLVRDVVAFGVQDSEWGEQLAVAYVPKDTVVSESALQTAVKDQLARFKYPKIWLRKNVLPRNESGKPLKEELLAMVKA